MSHRVRVATVVWTFALICLTLSVIGLAGCPGKPAPTPTATPPPPAAQTPPPAPTTPAATSEATPPPAESKEAPAASPEPSAPVKSAFKWTDKPSLSAIPKGPIVGQVNGKPFHAKAVRLKQDTDSVVLEISDKEPSSGPSGPLSGNTGIVLTFNLPAGKPGELVLGLDATKTSPNHAYYHYPQPTGGPMSVNCPYAVALKIASWTLKKSEANPDLLGKVNGQVAVCFGDDKKSWVAGSFEGVYFKW